MEVYKIFLPEGYLAILLFKKIIVWKVLNIIKSRMNCIMNSFVLITQLYELSTYT